MLKVVLVGMGRVAIAPANNINAKNVLVLERLRARRTDMTDDEMEREAKGCIASTFAPDKNGLMQPTFDPEATICNIRLLCKRVREAALEEAAKEVDDSGPTPNPLTLAQAIRALKGNEKGGGV